jgi:hypothetical protein
MTELKHAEDVGAPDPELNTSPIAEEGSDETEVLRQEVPGEPVCYFNNQSFPTGAYIKSGTSILTTLKNLEDKFHKGRQLMVSGLIVKFS